MPNDTLTFGIDLLPNSTTKEYNLGSATKKWNIFGDLQGNADTATQWASAQTVYVTLGTASTTTTLQGGNTNAETIGVDGILGIANGGTNTNSLTANRLLTVSSDAFTATNHYISTSTLGINTTSVTTNYTLEINGDTLSNGNIIPGTDKTLGSSSSRWSALYVGGNDSYGDAYTPVYWNAGVPAAVTTTTKVNFTITGNASGTGTGTITDSNTITANSHILDIVVNGGFSNLNSPISWTAASGTITLTADVPNGLTVTGYIIYRK